MKNNKTTKLFQDGNKELALQYLQKGLQELGLSLKDFPKLSYSHLTLDSHKKIAEAIQDQWFKVLGIHVSLEPTDYKSMLSKLSEKTFDMSQFSWVAQYNDQMSSLDRFTDRYHPKNYPGFENENYTRLIDLSRKTTDKEQRLLYMAQAEKIFVEEMPLTPLFHWNYALLKSPYLKDFYVSPIGSVHIEECYIENPEKGVALGNLF